MTNHLNNHKYQWGAWSTLFGLNTKPYSVIILNRPIQFTEKHCFKEVWNKAKLRIAVDGGTDSLLKWMEKNRLSFHHLSYPDIVSGDMDSISPKSLNYFKSVPGIKVIVTEDQSETDFTKAIREVGHYMRRENVSLDSIFVFTEMSGRFDQQISHINTLYLSSDIIPNCKVFLVCKDSLTWLLKKGKHTIDIPSVLRCKEEWCGLLPIGGPSIVSTTGLKWNLDKSLLKFGGMVSTSNTYDGFNTVSIETDNPIVWTMGIENLSL